MVVEVKVLEVAVYRYSLTPAAPHCGTTATVLQPFSGTLHNDILILPCTAPLCDNRIKTGPNKAMIMARLFIFDQSIYHTPSISFSTFPFVSPSLSLLTRLSP